MSRSLIYGTLCVLILLLGVMTYLLNPPPEKPQELPKAAEASTTPQEDPRKKMMNEMKEMRERMEKLAKVQKGDAKDGKGGKGAAQASKPLPQPPTHMEITGDWFKKRPDGAAGVGYVLKEREAQQKAYEAALAAAKKK